MSVTKIAQNQIRGQSKVDLQTEVAAIELAVQAAVGGTSYEDRALVDLSLKDLSGMFSKAAGGKPQLDKDMDANGKQILGAAKFQGAAAEFSNTVAGVLDATSAAVGGNASVGGTLGVTGQASAGSLQVSGLSQLAGVQAASVSTTGDVTVGGNLYVNGTTTSVNSTTMEVADMNIVIAKGAAEGTYNGAGFSLQSDAGPHFMHWDNAKAVWRISDGLIAQGEVAAPSAKIGGKMSVGGNFVQAAVGDDLKLAGDTHLVFSDKFIPGAGLPLNEGADYAGVFGLGAWAEGLSLIGALGRERTDRQGAVTTLSQSFTQALGAEKTRAMAAELNLHNDIVAEQTARANQDLIHDAAIAAEISRAQAAESVLDGKITAETGRATAAEGLLTSNLAAEVTRAQAAELVLTNGLAAEVTRATGIEAGLRSDLTAEVARATAAEQALRSDLNTEIADRIADVNAEESRAMAAEAVLDGKITTEANRAMGIEGGLRTDLNAEVARAVAADAAHSAAIAAEVARAQGAEAVLTNALQAEVSRAQAAELVLTNDLAAEVTARQGAFTTLRSEIAVGSLKLFVGKAPVGGFQPNDAFPVLDFAGQPAAFAKAASAYDVYFNGQKMSWNDDWKFSSGQIALTFQVYKDDLLEVREHGI